MKLQTKIILTTCAVVVIMGLLTMAAIGKVVETALNQQLDERGLSLMKVASENLANPLLDGELLVVQRILESLAGMDPGIEYAFVTGINSPAVVHTFPQGFPAGLGKANPLSPGERYGMKVLSTEKGLIRDVGLRVLDGLDAELHVGFSQRDIRRSLGSVANTIILLTLGGILVGVFAALTLSRRITRPLAVLAEHVERMGTGTLDDEIKVTSRDEIGNLAARFNQMTDSLRESIGQLNKRNRELSALNQVARAVSGRIDLNSMLERALSKVLELMGLKAGWIVLFTPGDESKTTLAAAQGFPGSFMGKKACCFPDCSRWIMPEDVRPVIVHPLGEECQMKLMDFGDGTAPHCHLSVPLVMKGRALGVLNVLGHDPDCFGEDDAELLAAIGRQLGVAIENVRLWEELRNRDELRTKLLSKVITAQEEERKRIARELHDETSQSLAALVVGLKAASTMVNNNEADVDKVLEDLKDGTNQTLKELHKIIYDLRPSLLDDLGLIPALRWYLESRLEVHGINTSMEVKGHPFRLPAEAEIAVFRIVQEALTNILKYAAAGEVQLELEFGDDGLQIRVADNGCGFDAESVLTGPNKKKGLGILGMVERANLLGGRLQVTSCKGQGTEITLEVPLGNKGGVNSGENPPLVG